MGALTREVQHGRQWRSRGRRPAQLRRNGAGSIALGQKYGSEEYLMAVLRMSPVALTMLIRSMKARVGCGSLCSPHPTALSAMWVRVYDFKKE